MERPYRPDYGPTEEGERRYARDRQRFKKLHPELAGRERIPGKPYFADYPKTKQGKSDYGRDLYKFLKENPHLKSRRFKRLEDEKNNPQPVSVPSTDAEPASAPAFTGKDLREFWRQQDAGICRADYFRRR